MMQQRKESGIKRNAILGGALTFCLPYCGRAKFDWWLDVFGHDVIVECMSPWRGLYSDIHQIGMGPKFGHDEAREIAEKLCRKIINNLEFVIRHQHDEKLEFESCYDNRQLPLYRKWAWEETKRRFVEVGLRAEAFKDDDDNYDAEDDAMAAEYVERAEDELKSARIEVVGEVGPLSCEELQEKWRMA